MPPFRIEWVEEAQADVRRMDRAVAMRIFDAVLHYARTGGGDVEPLHGDMAGSFRLRVGDWRVPFSLHEESCKCLASATAAKRTVDTAVEKRLVT